MTYQETVTWLFEQFPAYHNLGAQAYNPGFKNILELANHFGNPHKELRFIHVAGTNGKGSVSNMTASILTEAGETVGLFTSPHLFDFTERIRVNGQPISKNFVVDFCTEIRAQQWEIAPSFFEITWMMALSYFKAQNCSIVVAEVGLGGRLDATNIIKPLISVITNIGLEHTNLLGDTRAKIAYEKGGIIKPGIPVVLGENDEETYPVFVDLTQKNNAPILSLMELTTYPKSIIGYQRTNFSIVSTVCSYLNEAGLFAINETFISNGIQHLYRNTGFMGRMDLRGTAPNLWFDCAHNADGIRTLFENLPIQGVLHCVYGTSSDKNLEDIKAVLPQEATYYITTFDNPRSASLDKLKHDLIGVGEKRTFFSNSLDALKNAQESANKKDTIVVFGSFFLIHDFFSNFS